MLKLTDGITCGATRLIYGVAILFVLTFGAHQHMLSDMPTTALFDVEVEGTFRFSVVFSSWLVSHSALCSISSRCGRNFAVGAGADPAAAAVRAARDAREQQVVGTFATIMMTAPRSGSHRAAPARVHDPSVRFRAAPLTQLRGFESWLGGHRSACRGRRHRDAVPRAGAQDAHGRAVHRRHRSSRTPARHRRWLPFEDRRGAGGCARPSRGSAASRWPWSSCS